VYFLQKLVTVVMMYIYGLLTIVATRWELFLKWYTNKRVSCTRENLSCNIWDSEFYNGCRLKLLNTSIEPCYFYVWNLFFFLYDCLLLIPLCLFFFCYHNCICVVDNSLLNLCILFHNKMVWWVWISIIMTLTKYEIQKFTCFNNF